MEKEARNNTMGKIVSIRCRRHKRRFEVPEEWLKTSPWLCPKCYHKLTARERDFYAPPEKKHPAARVVAKKESKATTTKAKQIKRENIKVEKKEIVKPYKGFSPRLQELLPKLRMKCKKCHQLRPVHQHWLDKVSKIVCPSCLSTMTADEIYWFHKEHSNDEAKIINVDDIKELDRMEKAYKEYDKDPHNISSSGRCSLTFITHASEVELRQAVKEGKLSLARARIELKRRKKKEYYSDMPDIDAARL